MVTCKIHDLNGQQFATISLHSTPHTEEYIWLSDDTGQQRITYKVQTVVHGSEAVELFVQKQPAPLFR
jgi:hypothetical protein